MTTPENVSPLPRQGVTHAIVAVGPATATRWLEGNTHNRPVRDAHVDALARDMRAGRWRMTGDSIKFSQDGTLLDGQHRLWAVVVADCTVPLLVVRGLHPDAQDYVDIGTRRSVADALHLEGRTSTRETAALARACLMYLEPGRTPTHGEVLEYARKHAEALAQATYWLAPAKRGGLRGGSVYPLAAYVLAQVDEEAAETFMRALVTGVGLEPGDPVLALRNRFLRTPPRGGNGGSHLRVNLAYFVRAWNAFRDGRKLSHIRYQPGVDTYPVPR
jgi:hypothetical protein